MRGWLLMSSVRAGRVSLGGRRNGTAPPGNDIMRKKAASIPLADSMLRIHDGSSPMAPSEPAMASANAPSIQRRMRMLDKVWAAESRKYFKLHLLRTDVVGDVFAGDR